MESCDMDKLIAWDPGIDPGMDHPVRAIFAVQYGKLWLANGFTSCGGIIGVGTTWAYSESLLQAFEMTQNVKIINCIVKHLMFQGLPNNNIVTSRASSRVPIVQIRSPAIAYKHTSIL
jgi:hypothetical protein